MDNKKIKTYDECSIEEQQVIDSFRKMHLLFNHSRFNLYRFQIADLMDDYEQLKQLRDVIQAKYFAIYENLLAEELIEGELDVAQWGIDRENENETWSSEMQLMDEIKVNFDIAINMIESGEAEKSLIDMENSW